MWQHALRSEQVSPCFDPAAGLMVHTTLGDMCMLHVAVALQYHQPIQGSHTVLHIAPGSRFQHSVNVLV